MNGDKKKKRGGVSWAVIALILGAVLSALGNLDGATAFGFIFVIVILAVVSVIFGLVFSAIKRVINAEAHGSREESRSMRRESPEDREPRQSRREDRLSRREEDRPSIFRREPLEDKPVSHQREILPMDEYERQKRLNQLENFLKNGTIDKEEYRKLRARYER